MVRQGRNSLIIGVFLIVGCSQSPLEKQLNEAISGYEEKVSSYCDCGDPSDSTCLNIEMELIRAQRNVDTLHYGVNLKEAFGSSAEALYKRIHDANNTYYYCRDN